MNDSPAGTGSGNGEGKRPYFRPTTTDQRKLLFRAYEETGSATAAARVAHVGVGTFYYCKRRLSSRPRAGIKVGQVMPMPPVLVLYSPLVRAL
jgi:hypothetical protein